MVGWIRSQLGIYMIITILHGFALTSIRPIVSLQAAELGASTETIGILISIYALFPAFLAIALGKWVDRIGSNRTMFIAGLFSAVTLLFPILLPGLTSLFIAQIALGLSNNLMITSLIRGVSLVDGDKDKASALLITMFSVGEVIGPISGGFLYQWHGFQTLLLTSLAAMLLWSFASTRIYNIVIERSAKKEKQSSTFALLKQLNIRKALILSGLVVFGKDMFITYFPLYGAQAGMAPGTIGLIISLLSLAMVIIRIFQYPLLQRFRRESVIAVCLVIAGVAFVLLPLTGVPVILMAIALMLGMGLGLGQPLSWVYLLNYSPPGREGEVLGMRSMFNRISQLTLPALMGVAGGAFGLSLVFWVCGLSMVGGAFYTRPETENHSEMNEAASHK